VVERLAGLQQRVAAFCEADMPQGMGLAPGPARAETKPTPTKSTPTKPTPAKPPDSTAPQPKSPNDGEAPPKPPAKKPRPNSKPASPLDEEEPPLSRQSHRLRESKNADWVSRFSAIEDLRRYNIR
jgi:hypothetical protein